MSKPALVYLVLLFCLGQSGCDRKPSFQIPVEQPTHDATGYLIQPEEEFLVGGERPGWNRLFIQFNVSGNEARPFILNVEDTMQPHDNWPPAPEPKTDRQSSSGLLWHPIEGPTPPFGHFSLNAEEVAKLAEAAGKYFVWSETAAKENLNVAEKELMRLTREQVDNITNAKGVILIGSTNRQSLSVTFSRPKESPNSYMNISVPDSLLPQSSLPMLPFSITLDKMGVNRLLSVITNLPSRREKFIAFRDEQEKIVRQRGEAQQNEKARADELLH